jgi:hypothetical protein
LRCRSIEVLGVRDLLGLRDRAGFGVSDNLCEALGLYCIDRKLQFSILDLELCRDRGSLRLTAADLMVDIETPSGEVLAIDDPALIVKLCEGLDRIRALSLVRSDRSFSDCRPVSVFSIQTARQIGDEVGLALDKRRFRANIYADLTPMNSFAENAFVDRRLQIGTKAVIAVTDRDPRCKMITLDPKTAQAEPKVLRTVRDNHEGKAGLYGAVLVEGTVRPGDEIRLLD